MSADTFYPCEICGQDEWKAVYRGPVRDGAFGRLTAETVVARCGGCGVERLAEEATRPEEFYQNSDYRKALAEPTDASGFFTEHDVLQLQNLKQLWPESLRNKAVADVGCAAGSFLDHIRGLAAHVVAVDPCVNYHPSLASRGYRVFSFIDEAVGVGVKVDWAFSFSVIEHVDNPRIFLADIGRLLKPSGRLLISTPNRADVLMELLPDVYPTFFYRSVHRWYFDAASLARCAQEAGLTIIDMHCVHRFGLSNAFKWLRDRRPGGRERLPYITPLFDTVWAKGLEAQGVGDYLYAVLAGAHAV